MRSLEGAPLAQAVAAYIEKGRLRGHMPGHKGQPGANGLLERWGELAAWDVTEAEGLDDLHMPAGVIAEAQELLARAAGAEQAYFLVNGASVGIVAGVLAACGALRARQPSLKAHEVRVVLPRNAHRSAWNAVALAGCTPVWLPVAKMAESPGLTLGVEPERLGDALAHNPNVAAALFVYPSYYGVLVDLARLLEICRERGVVSLVDEAHGAHLAFVEQGRAAVSLGADLAVDSWHKSMGSLGQGAVLLAGKGGGELAIGRWLSMLQTTSPSYPIMASIDVARAEWRLHGQKRTAALRRSRELIRQTCRGLNLLRLFESDMLPPGFGYDAAKALLFSSAGHSGWQLADALRQAGLEPELADWRFALLLLSYADNDPAGWRQGLRRADAILCREQAGSLESLLSEPGLPEQALTPGEALRRRTKLLPLPQAVGHIAAGLLTPYPPGIPWVGPGERISPEVAGGLLAVLAGGGRVQGVRSSGSDSLVAVLA